MLTTPAVPLAADAVPLAAGVVALAAAGVEAAGLVDELELLEHAATVRLSATAAASPTGRRYRTMAPPIIVDPC
jgi:hypothetical protein